MFYADCEACGTEIPGVPEPLLTFDAV